MGWRRVLVVMAIVVAPLWFGLVRAAPVSAAGCEIVLGFKTLAGAVPAVGVCLDDAVYDADGARQHTTGGLLVWRRADGFTAFTDGANTWVMEPHGVQRRPNQDRFCWEPDATTSCGQLAPPSNSDLRFSLDAGGSSRGEAHGKICNRSRLWDALNIRIAFRPSAGGTLSQRTVSAASVSAGSCSAFLADHAASIAQTKWLWLPHAQPAAAA